MAQPTNTKCQSADQPKTHAAARSAGDSKPSPKKGRIANDPGCDTSHKQNAVLPDKASRPKIETARNSSQAAAAAGLGDPTPPLFRPRRSLYAPDAFLSLSLSLPQCMNVWTRPLLLRRKRGRERERKRRTITVALPHHPQPHPIPRAAKLLIQRLSGRGTTLASTDWPGKIISRDSRLRQRASCFAQPPRR